MAYIAGSLCGREHRSVSLLPEPVGSVLAIITIWEASPIRTESYNLERKEAPRLSLAGRVYWTILVAKMIRPSTRSGSVFYKKKPPIGRPFT
jgi:hypothetical protein